MIELIQNWLAEQGVQSAYLVMATQLIGLFMIVLIALVSFYITKHQVLVLVQKLVVRSKNTWDDLLIEYQVFSRVAWLVPLFVFMTITPVFLSNELVLTLVIIVVAKVALCFQIARCIDVVLNVVKRLSQHKAKDRHLPINSTIQVIKLAIYIIATILAVAVIVDKSPVYLLSGLGALTAVLLLVFQDTIKGLVASIQISANKMLAPGDWIEIPKYGADGDVLEIGLNTVKVQNFDNTVTTVPTYALINGSFKNWRDMFSSGGRRIKRSITLDINSVKFFNRDEITSLERFALLNNYLQVKKQEIAKEAQENNLALDDINGRQLTNIGTFRAYITAYLRNHNKIHQNMTCMVRQLPATSAGISLEIYCFSNDQNWVNYEAIQADIFDHLFAIAPEFGMRIFQHPTGYDWQSSNLKN